MEVFAPNFRKGSRGASFLSSGFICITSATQTGAMAEWLCSGLQIRVRRFDSGLRLQNTSGPQQ